jgi:hypothetical protein
MSAGLLAKVRERTLLCETQIRCATQRFTFPVCCVLHTVPHVAYLARSMFGLFVLFGPVLWGLLRQGRKDVEDRLILGLVKFRFCYLYDEVGGVFGVVLGADCKLPADESGNHAPKK